LIQVASATAHNTPSHWHASAYKVCLRTACYGAQYSFALRATAHKGEKTGNAATFPAIPTRLR